MVKCVSERLFCSPPLKVFTNSIQAKKIWKKSFSKRWNLYAENNWSWAHNSMHFRRLHTIETQFQHVMKVTISNFSPYISCRCRQNNEIRRVKCEKVFSIHEFAVVVIDYSGRVESVRVLRKSQFLWESNSNMERVRLTETLRNFFNARLKTGGLRFRHIFVLFGRCC